MKIPRRIWIWLAVCAASLIAALAGAYYFNADNYNGHSAEYWLRKTLSPNTVEATAAAEALREMGPRADSALLAGFQARETAPYRFAKRIFLNRRGPNLYSKLPPALQRIVIDCLNEGNPDSLRFASERAVRASHSLSITAKLFPLLASPDSLTRRAVLGALSRGSTPPTSTPNNCANWPSPPATNRTLSACEPPCALRTLALSPPTNSPPSATYAPTQTSMSVWPPPGP